MSLKPFAFLASLGIFWVLSTTAEAQSLAASAAPRSVIPRPQITRPQITRQAPQLSRPITVPALPPGLQCRQAIAAAERAAAIPLQLMAAIGRVESGRPDARGVVHPWPWTINAEGAGQYFDSKDAAIAAVRALQARGVQSVDVGCMQVNLFHHPAAFASLDQAFDPTANATYAARYLNELYAQSRDWTRATAFYHSATPERGENYQKRVAAVWPQEQQRVRDTPLPAANVWTRNAFTANMWNTAGRPTAPGPQRAQTPTGPRPPIQTAAATPRPRL